MNAISKKELLLIVDDNEMNRDMLSLRFQKIGYLTEAVESGFKALEYIEKFPVDAILLDIMMPNMTGFEVLEKLRQSYSPITLPIIVVTALESSEDVIKALELGANDYLTKPINFPVALARVRTQLSHKNLEGALRESEERYALALQGSNDGIWDWNLKTNFVYFSPHFEEMLGFEAGALGNDPKNWFNRIHPSESENFECALKAHFLGETPLFEFRHRLLNKEGVYRWILTRGVAILDNNQNAIRMAGSQTDITKTMITDLVTGLPNEVLFIDRLELIIERAERFNFQYAILLIEINRFNEICENYGLQFGDVILIEFAKRLKGCMRGYDTLSYHDESTIIAHLTGSKFSILLEDTKNTNDIMRVISRIKETLEAPVVMGDIRVSIAFNTGIVLNEESCTNAKELSQRANIALSKAKLQGEWSYAIFDQEMHKNAIIKWEFEEKLKLAIQNKEFVIFYQPIISLKDHKLTGFEALVRWKHPVEGFITPMQFIPVAEENGLIIPLGKLIFHEVCLQVKTWKQLLIFPEDFTVSVNVSSKQFNGSLMQEINDIFKETKIDSKNIKIEITESVMLEKSDVLDSLFEELSRLRVQLSMDDFGTGYSSLSALRKFPINTLKIDQSFVREMTSSKKHFEIVKTIILLAHNLDTVVVGEGVETKEQLEILKEFGCDYVQGYYFAKPQDVQNAEAILKKRESRFNPL